MAMLDADRTATMRQFAKKIFQEVGTTANMDTVELKAAVDAVDGWVDANQASYNTALPVPFKTTATAQQKALLLVYVVMKREGLI